MKRRNKENKVKSFFVSVYSWFYMGCHSIFIWTNINFLLSNLSLFSPYFFLFSPYLIRSSVALKSSSYIILYHDMCQIKIDLEHVSWYDSILVKGNLINVFGQTVVTVTFQSAFHSEIYQNNIFFYFLKIIFDISTSKWSKNTKKNINLKPRKKIKKF